MDSLISQFKDKSFWMNLVPGFGIEDPASFANVELWDVPGANEIALRESFVRQGYVHLPRLHGLGEVARLADAVRTLAKAGIPPVFAMVYDQFWIPAYSLNRVLKAAFGSDYFMLPDIWVWHVDPAKAESGWRPHREKGHVALFPDKSPKTLSVWLALSKATPLNSCMYIVPADRDPTYGTEDDTKWNFELPDVRALPAESGDVFMWTQGLLHWGGHAAPCQEPPRISMSFEFLHSGVGPFDAPLLEPLTIIPFKDRLKLIGKQLLQFQHMYEMSPELEALACGLVRAPSVAIGPMLLPDEYV